MLLSLGSQDKGIGMTSKPQFVLYCISGHKMYAGRLPTYDLSARDNIHVGQSNREVRGWFICVYVVCIMLIVSQICGI